MRKFLSVVWGDTAQSRIQIGNPLALECRGDLSGEELFGRLHLQCVNDDLRSLIFSCQFFTISTDILRLVSVAKDGAETFTAELNGLRPPTFRHFLWFALQCPDWCRITAIIFPELFKWGVVSLCPNNGYPLLCCTAPEYKLFGDNAAVLALEKSRPIGV